MRYSFRNAISIVIPAFNEEENIEPLIDEIVLNLGASSFTYEIIVIDDGSNDLTMRVLHQKQKHLNNLRVLQHTTNQGQTAALFTGIRHANHEWIVSLDGDGQVDPKDITKLILAMKKSKENTHGLLVVGYRVQRQDTWIKKISSKIANNVRRAILKDTCMDTGCSLKLFPRDAILDLPQFNHFHRFIPAMLELKKIPTLNLPVNHRKRKFGISKYGINNRLWVSIADMYGVKWLKKRYIQNMPILEISQNSRNKE